MKLNKGQITKIAEVTGKRMLSGADVTTLRYGLMELQKSCQLIYDNQLDISNKQMTGKLESINSLIDIIKASATSLKKFDLSTNALGGLSQTNAVKKLIDTVATYGEEEPIK